jgi:hypothetical protein
LHSFDICDLLIPGNPIACTRSSTRRVETPPIRASWMTPISAFFRVLARLRERREVAALPQLGNAQLQRAEASVKASFAVTVASGGARCVDSARCRSAPRRRSPSTAARPPRPLLAENRPRRPSPTTRPSTNLSSVIGLLALQVEVCNSTLADRPEWTPQTHRSSTPRAQPETPPRTWTLTPSEIALVAYQHKSAF